MSIRFECPSCGDVSMLKDRMAGKSFRCPECGLETIVRTAPEEETDEELAEAPATLRIPVRFLGAAGIVVVAIVGVVGVMVLRSFLNRPAPPPPPAPLVKQAEPPKETKGQEDEWLKRAADALVRADYELAISCSTDAIQANPRNPAGYRLRAEAYRGKNHFTSALSDYTEVIKLNPNDGSAYVGRAAIYAALSDIPRAVENCQMAEKLGVKRAQAGEKIAAILRGQGVEYIKKVRLIKKEADAFRTTVPVSAEEIFSLADDDGKKANEYLLAARQLNSKDPGVYEDLGLLCLTYASHDEAIKALNAGLQLNAKAALLYFYRGAAYSHKGNRQQAEADYQRAVQLDKKLALERHLFYKH